MSRPDAVGWGRLLQLGGAGDRFGSELGDLLGPVDAGLVRLVGDDQLGPVHLHTGGDAVVRLHQQRPHAGAQLGGDAGELLREQPSRIGRRRHRVVRAGEHDLVESAVAQRGGSVAPLLAGRGELVSGVHQAEQGDEADGDGEEGGEHAHHHQLRGPLDPGEIGLVGSGDRRVVAEDRPEEAHQADVAQQGPTHGQRDRDRRGGIEEHDRRQATRARSRRRPGSDGPARRSPPGRAVGRCGGSRRPRAGARSRWRPRRAAPPAR